MEVNLKPVKTVLADVESILKKANETGMVIALVEADAGPLHKRLVKNVPLAIEALKPQPAEQPLVGDDEVPSAT